MALTNFLKRFYLFIFKQKGKEGKGRERNINVWLPLLRPLPGIWPVIQARAQTGSQTRDPVGHGLTLNPLSYTSHGNMALKLMLQPGLDSDCQVKEIGSPRSEICLTST